MRFAPLPGGVLVVVVRKPWGLEVVAQEGLSAGTVARAVSRMLLCEQEEDGVHRSLVGTFGRGLGVAS